METEKNIYQHFYVGITNDTYSQTLEAYGLAMYIQKILSLENIDARIKITNHQTHYKISTDKEFEVTKDHQPQIFKLTRKNGIYEYFDFDEQKRIFENIKNGNKEESVDLFYDVFYMLSSHNVNPSVLTTFYSIQEKESDAYVPEFSSESILKHYSNPKIKEDDTVKIKQVTASSFLYPNSSKGINSIIPTGLKDSAYSNMDVDVLTNAMVILGIQNFGAVTKTVNNKNKEKDKFIMVIRPNEIYFDDLINLTKQYKKRKKEFDSSYYLQSFYLLKLIIEYVELFKKDRKGAYTLKENIRGFQIGVFMNMGQVSIPIKSSNVNVSLEINEKNETLVLFKSLLETTYHIDKQKDKFFVSYLYRYLTEANLDDFFSFISEYNRRILSSQDFKLYNLFSIFNLKTAIYMQNNNPYALLNQSEALTKLCDVLRIRYTYKFSDASQDKPDYESKISLSKTFLNKEDLVSTICDVISKTNNDSLKTNGYNISNEVLKNITDIIYESELDAEQIANYIRASFTCFVPKSK